MTKVKKVFVITQNKCAKKFTKISMEDKSI